MREAVLATEDNGAALMDGKQLESAGKIMAKSGIDGLRIGFRLQSSFIDANQFLSFSGLLPETIVSDPVKPGRKTRFAAKAAKVLVSPEKSFLREIVRQGDVAPDQIPEQTPLPPVQDPAPLVAARRPVPMAVLSPELTFTTTLPFLATRPLICTVALPALMRCPFMIRTG